MPVTKDLAGQKFGFLTVLGPAPVSGDRKKWSCVCVCKKETYVPTSKLKDGSTKSCGCMKGKMPSAAKIKGQNLYFEKVRQNLWEKISRRVEELGYKLQTNLDEFLESCKNAKRSEQVLFSLECKNGHAFRTRWSCFKKNKCPHCSMTAKKTPEAMRVELEKKGWQFISFVGEYKNKYSTISCICKKGHAVTKSYNMMMSAGCIHCQKENQIVPFEKTLGLIEKENYLVISAPEWPYDSLTGFLLQCPKGHKYITTRHAWVSDGTRCTVCAKSINESKGELEVKNALLELGIKAEKYNEGNFEIDVYLPEYKIGIEFNGIYWHSTARVKNTNVHKHKYLTARNMGIKLIQIWEDEWYQKKDIILSLILSKIPNRSDKYFARSCEVIDVPFKQATAFLNENHLQGAGGNNLLKAVGLQHKDRLLMLATVGMHQRQGHEGKNVLTRVCYAKNVRIVGGMERLLHYLPRPLITWSDNRYSDGNLYRACGFRIEKELPPDYCYVKGGKRISKQSLRKTEEEKKVNKTEKELRDEQGYHRLYDAGKIRWILE